jgi:hypothetical protein
VYLKETSNWALQARGQDVGNLIAVLALMTGCYMMINGLKKGLFVWTGSLMYFLYAFIIYAFFVHFNYLFLLYVSVIGLSFYALYSAVTVPSRFELKVSDFIRKSAGVILLCTGILFLFLWLSEILPSLCTNQVPSSLKDTGLWVNPVHVIDLSIVLPGMIITGRNLLKRNEKTTIFAIPWLTFSVLMGSSILATLFMMNIQDVNSLVPIIMVGSIVLSSFVVLLIYLKKSY